MTEQAEDDAESDTDLDDDVKCWGKNSLKASAGCWFHVGNHVVKKDSFAGRFKNKTYSGIKKKRFGKVNAKTNEPSGRLCGHLCATHACKTDAQRTAVRDLITRHWIEESFEVEAATLFIKSHGVVPFENWNYNAAGEVGVYPSNCPNESHNHHAAKNKTDTLNVSLPVHLVEKMPAMLHQESLLRNDPCTIETPTQHDHLSMVMNVFYKPGRDVVIMDTDDNGIAKEWLMAVGGRIGHQITNTDKCWLACATDGFVEPFMKQWQSKGKSFAFADVAVSMTKVTTGCCHVRIRQVDGKVVGDCQECIKHLGYRCPAVNYIRSKHGQLDGGVNVLDNGVRVILNKKGHLRHNQKNTSALCTGGLLPSWVAEKQTPVEFTEDRQRFLETLNEEQAFEACMCLKLEQWCHLPLEELKSRGHSKQDIQHCVGLLQEFYTDPVRFRNNQEEIRQTL